MHSSPQLSTVLTFDPTFTFRRRILPLNFSHIPKLEVSVKLTQPDIAKEEKCGTAEPRVQLPEALIEKMKLVFRDTHGGEMTQEDRDFLGIPPCTGECCP